MHSRRSKTEWKVKENNDGHRKRGAVEGLRCEEVRLNKGNRGEERRKEKRTEMLGGEGEEETGRLERERR